MKENKKAKKVVALLLCAVLLVVGSVSATVAYLTDTKTVTNTFTVGKVAITLDEAVVNEYGEVQGGRTSEGATQTYKLIPGHTYVKDPTVYFQAGSEKSYLFVKVENGIAGIEADTNKIETQITANWTKGDGINVPEDVYYRVVEANTTPDPIKYEVFNEFIIANVTSDVLNTYNGKNIVIKAYAVQFDGISDVKTAWDAVKTL